MFHVNCLEKKGKKILLTTILNHTLIVAWIGAVEDGKLHAYHSDVIISA